MRVATCAYCGASMPVGEHACLICGAERGGVPAIPSMKSGGGQEWANQLKSPRFMRRSARRATALGIVLTLALLLGASGVAVFEYFMHQNTVAQYTAAQAVLFQTGDTLQINIPGLGGSTIITNDYRVDRGIRRTVSLSADSSSDSRFIAYLNDRERTYKGDYKGDLYLLDLVLLSEGDEENQGFLLKRDVIDFRFLPRDGRILYLTQDGDLYLCDYSGLLNPLYVIGRTRVWQLDSGVSGIGIIDGRYLLYYKGALTNTSTWRENMETEVGRPLDLYLISLENEDALPVRVDTGVYRVLDTMREFERVVLKKRTQMPPFAMYDVFVFSRRSGESVQIARGARHVVDANASMGAVLCLSPSEEETRFRDIINDDMLDYDQMLTAPRWADYALDEEEDIDAIDPAVIEEIYDRYDRDLRLYEEKLARDQLRRSLRQDIRDYQQNNYISFGLFYTDGETTIKLADQIYNRGGDVAALAWGSVERGIALYVRGEREAMRSILMSDLDHSRVLEFDQGLDIMQHLTINMPEILWYHKAGEEPREVFAVESGARRIERFLMIDDGIYFSVLWEQMFESGTLYYTSTSGDGMGPVLYLDEYVTDYIGTSGATGSSLVYRKLTRGDSGRRDISIATDGSPRIIAQGTDPYEEVMLLGENASIFAYYRAPELHPGSVRLYVNGQQERFIAQSISGLGLHNEDLIYLLRDERSGRSLHLYHMGETIFISGNIIDAMFFGLPS